MEKQINAAWMNDLLHSKSGNNPQNDLPKLEWVQNNKGFKRKVHFKVLPSSSKENQIFGWIVGTHWNVGPNMQRFLCPEKTPHLKHLGIKCPICEAKRRLLAEGFKEEQLTTQGKYGPISLFDPLITSSVKAVILDSDTDNVWDQAHISILQQKGDCMVKWLVEKYIKPDTPDFLTWENSYTIEFSRETDNGRWQREPSFATFNPSPAVLAKLKEENEAIYMPDLWKAPSDQEILEATQLMQDRIAEYHAIKQAATVETNTDEIPF